MEVDAEQPIRAIIADDDRIAREIVSRTLERWRFEVTTVADGEDAWRCLAKTQEPTLAILDWMMPGMNGPDVCRRARQERPPRIS